MAFFSWKFTISLYFISFDIIGNVQVVIHSKGSEGNIEGTDVSTQYSDNSNGIVYKSINNDKCYLGKVLTTRSNGHIYIEIFWRSIWRKN